MTEMDELDAEIQRIKSAYQGVFDRIERATEDERAYIFCRILNDWCTGCGKPLGECDDENNERCCDTPWKDITAKWCPKCEFIIWDTVKETT